MKTTKSNRLGLAIAAAFISLAALLLLPGQHLFAQAGATLQVYRNPQVGNPGSVGDTGAPPNNTPIDCPGICSYTSGVGSIIFTTLEATPAAGFVFDHWEWGGTFFTGWPIVNGNEITIYIESGKLGTVTAHFALIPSHNEPPVLDPVGDQTVNEGALLEFTVTASDPDHDILAFTADGLPHGAALSPVQAPQSAAFSWTPDYTQAGAYDVTFEVNDGQATDTETVTITVNNVNRPPVLDPIGNKTVQEGDLLEFDISATDPDGDHLTYYYSTPGLPLEPELNPNTGRFSWRPSIGESGVYQIEFQASDGEDVDSEIVIIAVETALCLLPDPFPYDQVAPPQGSAGVDPENVCLSWPETLNAQTYDLLLSKNQQLSPVEMELTELVDPQYCFGAPAASRIGENLEYGQTYFWRITARNLHGEVRYPIFGFVTRMPEELELESPEPLPDSVYRMISIPLLPDDPRIMAVLGDDFGQYYRFSWRMFRYSSGDGQNHEYPNLPDIAPGFAYWLISKEGVKIDAHGTPVDTATDFVIPIPPGFFQLGCPFPFPVSWWEVKVRKDGVTVLIGDTDNEWINPSLRKYQDGQYIATDILEPWQGYWIENISTDEVDLLIPPTLHVEEEIAEE